jgi:integrase
MASILRIGDRWRAQVRRKGAKSITKTFPTKAAATSWARKIEADLEAGIGTFDAATVTVGMLIARYRELREDSGRDIADTTNEWYILRRLEDGFGEKQAAALEVDEIIEWCQMRRREGAGPLTINMDISKLGTVFRHAGSAMRLRLPDVVGYARPTLHHLGLVGSGGKRERRPTEDELSRLFAWFDENRERLGPPMTDIVYLAIVLGLRRGEIFRILWSDFDRARKMILVRDRKDPRKKIGNDQWVPLIGDALELIERQPQTQARIFPYHPQTVSKYFKWACDACSIPDLRFHDCRHEAASALIEAGWSAHEVRAVTGHKTSQNLDRYVNINVERLARKPVQTKIRIPTKK